MLYMHRRSYAQHSTLPNQFLAQIERGKMTMKIGTLRKLCAVLSVSADYIINGTEEYPSEVEVKSLLAPLSENEREKAVKMLAAFTKILTEQK